MREILRQTGIMDKVTELRKPRVNLPEKLPCNPPDLTGCRLVVETRGISFSRRERQFGSTFSHERARRAFEDYKDLRDLTDKLERRHSIETQLEARRKMKGARREVTLLEKALRLNESLYNPRGGEIVLLCSDFDEAKQRAYELIGPVEPDLRKDRYARLGESKAMHDQGKNGPYNGFEAEVEFESNGKLHQFSRSWRLDIDPEGKGPHFNIFVRPRATYVDRPIYFDNHEPESLAIAFVYPGNKQSYDTTLHMLGISAITSMVNGHTAHALDYLEGVESYV